MLDRARLCRDTPAVTNAMPVNEMSWLWLTAQEMAFA